MRSHQGCIEMVFIRRAIKSSVLLTGQAERGLAARLLPYIQMETKQKTVAAMHCMYKEVVF